MKAIQFNASIPRYALGITLGKLFPSLLWSGASCLYPAEVPKPALPTPEWVLVRTRLGGICGSDTSTIQLRISTYYEPYSSSPFTIGHENMGVIAEVGVDVTGLEPGMRVTVEPLLWCAPRGFANDPCPACERGEVNRCARVREGDLAPGLLLGACRDTGGSWGEYFLAHQSQVYPVPDAVSDENALMVEPFAVGIHAALQNMPSDQDTVIIQGAGTIGLTVLAGLRAAGSQARIIVLARYPFQAEAAQKLGASEVVQARAVDVYAAVAERTGAELLKPILGKRVIHGGADMVFECVGSDSAIDDALRMARPGGVVVLVGVPGLAKGIDWTSIFFQELTVRASNIYHHAEPYAGGAHKAFGLALRWMAAGEVDLGWMVTHRYTLDELPRAMREIMQRRGHRIIKAALHFA